MVEPHIGGRGYNRARMPQATLFIILCGITETSFYEKKNTGDTLVVVKEA